MSALLAITYGVSATLTCGAVVAEFQTSYPLIAAENFRRDFAFAVFVSLTPVGWFITIFVTGFYEHGFQWTRRATLQREVSK